MKDIFLLMLKTVLACVLIVLAAWVGYNVWYVNYYTPEEREMIEDVRRRLDAGLLGDKAEVRRDAARVGNSNTISTIVCFKM